MVLSGASDIVTDGLRRAEAAAPNEVRQAFKTGRAASPDNVEGSASAAGSGFDRVFSAKPDGSNEQSVPHAGDDAALRDSHRRFEAMVLQMFVQSMLPSDAEQVFGSGTAGEMWKSMMAEQLGEMIAKGGGVGIASYLSRRDAALDADA